MGLIATCIRAHYDGKLHEVGEVRYDMTIYSPGAKFYHFKPDGKPSLPAETPAAPPEPKAASPAETTLANLQRKRKY